VLIGGDPIAHEEPSREGERGETYRENTDGVDGQLIQIRVTHDGRFWRANRLARATGAIGTGAAGYETHI
jgi:hypothetical protein